MDEPCSALDPISSKVIETLIERLSKIVTVVIVTHNLAQAKRVSQQMAFLWWKGETSSVLETNDTTEFFRNPRHQETRDYIQSERI